LATGEGQRGEARGQLPAGVPWARPFAIFGSALWLSACHGGVLDPKGVIGVQEKTILLDALAVMLAIAIPTIVGALAFAWWFRDSNPKARYRPEFVYSGRVELLVWSIPILTILFLGGLTWIGSYQLDPRRPIASSAPALNVQVVSLDWKWLFIYPDQGVAAVNRLVVPAGRPLHLSLTSASVFNVFFAPQLGSEIYAMNGMVSELNLQADQPGDYYGQSAHFSGDGFSDMHFDVKAVPQADFDRWVAGAKASGPTLDGPAYAGLARQGLIQPLTYRAVQMGLFQSIASGAIAAGPGPAPMPAAAPASMPMSGR